MVNSLKMKDGPHVVVLGPLGKLEDAPVDEAVVVGEGGHHLEQKLNLSRKIICNYQYVHNYRILSPCTNNYMYLKWIKIQPQRGQTRRRMGP